MLDKDFLGIFFKPKLGKSCMIFTNNALNCAGHEKACLAVFSVFKQFYHADNLKRKIALYNRKCIFFNKILS